VGSPRQHSFAREDGASSGGLLAATAAIAAVGSADVGARPGLHGSVAGWFIRPQRFDLVGPLSRSGALEDGGPAAARLLLWGPAVLDGRIVGRWGALLRRLP
jgi:hypothetical protein